MSIRDRALGAIVGAAVGDALGAGYEFELIPTDLEPKMIGGGLGPFEPGEWTDDTSLTWCVLEAAATVGSELKSAWGLQLVAMNFYDWYASRPPDIGGTTARAMSAGPSGRGMAAEAAAVDGQTNGSLMRTAPVAVTYLDDPWALKGAAEAVSALTHAHANATEACAVWSLGIRKTIMTEEFNLLEGVKYLHRDSRDFWEAGIEFAEENHPSVFWDNGKALIALQAAWSSIKATEELGFEESLKTAIRIGGDTDTVGSIAGAMLGARWGLDAIPAKWKNVLHGYPGLNCSDLIDLTEKTFPYHLLAHV